AVALRRHHLARGKIDLVGDVCDVVQGLPVELREERNPLQELHLGVFVESHRANISPSEALATVIGWASFRRSSPRRRVWLACCWCSWECRSRRSSRTAATFRQRTYLAARKLTQQYWYLWFAELIVDRLWPHLHS